MFTGSIEDRLIIRERYSAYSDASFQSDVERWLACWTDDPTWEVFGQTLTGKASMREQWDTTWLGMDRMAFFSELGDLQITGDTARARAYCREIVVMKDNSLMKVVGQYDDMLMKVDDDWFFSERRYTLLINDADHS